MCLCTVASEASFSPPAISSKLGLKPFSSRKPEMKSSTCFCRLVNAMGRLLALLWANKKGKSRGWRTKDVHSGAAREKKWQAKACPTQRPSMSWVGHALACPDLPPIRRRARTGRRTSWPRGRRGARIEGWESPCRKRQVRKRTRSLAPVPSPGRNPEHPSERDPAPLRARRRPTPSHCATQTEFGTAGGWQAYGGPPASSGFLELVGVFARRDAVGDGFLAGDAITRPRDGFQPFLGNRLVAFHASCAGPNLDAVQGIRDFPQQLHVDRVPVKKNPLLVMLLAQIALVGGAIQPGYDLGGLLCGHTATDFLRLLLEYLAVAGEFRLGSVLHGLNHFSLRCKPQQPDLNDADPAPKVA